MLPLIVFGLLAILQVGLVVRDQVAVVHAAREAARAASVDRDPGSATTAARRVLKRAEVQVGARPAVGQAIRVEVTYHDRTDLPLVGDVVPGPGPARARGDAGGAVRRTGNGAGCRCWPSWRSCSPPRSCSVSRGSGTRRATAPAPTLPRMPRRWRRPECWRGVVTRRARRPRPARPRRATVRSWITVPAPAGARPWSFTSVTRPVVRRRGALRVLR